VNGAAGFVPGGGQRPLALAAFHNAHLGQRIVVCGCGASLKELANPGEHITIGVNDVGRLFDPTYLVVVNPRTQFKGDRFRHVEHSHAQVLFTQLDLGRVRPPVARVKLGKYGGTEIGTTDVLPYTQNSPYVAVCLAAYMGARHIGLIGVDFTDDHFFAPTGRHPLAGRLHEIDAQYGRLADALRRRGVTLVNLSGVSRLTSLPRIRLDDARWVSGEPAPAATVSASDRELNRRSLPMKIAIERYSGGPVAHVLDALAATAASLGHAVVRPARSRAPDAGVLSIVWNGRGRRAGGATLYCEHGWLPRSAYQISPRGINADSHLAPFTWNGSPLSEEQNATLDRHLAAIKAASFTGYDQYMQAAAAAAVGVPRDFLLVPLQIESDTNILRHAPANLRTMQALIDYVSAVDPPWPVIFKQHPADTRRGSRQLRLRIRRRQDLLWPQARGNIHQMLKGGACRGILTINSNVAHDGLLWDVPAIVLGRNVWPTTGAHVPFLTTIPRDWSELLESVTAPERIACRRAYAHFLVTNQWTLADATDPSKVAGLLGGARSPVPLERTRPTVRTPPTLRLPRKPMLNVVAESRGWLFDAWKRRLAEASDPAFQVVASNKPLARADAWIFVRAREAAATPDPLRTVVQIHDFMDDGQYARGGSRAGVARCAGLSLTHPLQRDVLAANGIDLASRRWIMQPVGWSRLADGGDATHEVPTVAWVGRPVRVGGVDVSGLTWFVDAVRSLRTRPRVVLVGEGLDATAIAMKRLGIDCRVYGLATCPLHRATEWLRRFTCVVLSGTADSGPWPLFDAMLAGVAVIARPVGWAARLLEDGSCGRLVNDATAMGAAIDEILAARKAWHERRALIRARVADFSTAAWVQSNLNLAAELIRRSAEAAA